MGFNLKGLWYCCNMKLSIKDIKSKLSQKPQIVKPQQEKFENFRVGEIDLAPHQITDDV